MAMSRWQRWKQTTIANKWLVLTGAIVALGTIGQVGIAVFTSHLMNRQLTEMKTSSADTHDLAVAAEAQSKQAEEQTRKMSQSLEKTDSLIRQATTQAIATNNLAREAKRSADIAQDAFQLNERPWVGIHELRFPRELALGDREIELAVILINTGRTPALNATIIGVWDFRNTKFPPQDWSNLIRSDPALLFASQTTGYIPLNVTINDQSQLVSYRARKLALYGLVRIEYADVFGSNHWTEQCLAHVFGETGVFRFCGSGVDEYKSHNQKD